MGNITKINSSHLVANIKLDSICKDGDSRNHMIGAICDYEVEFEALTDQIKELDGNNCGFRIYLIKDIDQYKKIFSLSAEEINETFKSVAAVTNFTIDMGGIIHVEMTSNDEVFELSYSMFSVLPVIVISKYVPDYTPLDEENTKVTMKGFYVMRDFLFDQLTGEVEN